MDQNQLINQVHRTHMRLLYSPEKETLMKSLLILSMLEE